MAVALAMDEALAATATAGAKAVRRDVSFRAATRVAAQMESNRGRGERQPQRSFYRGPDTDQFEQQSSRNESFGRDRNRGDNNRNRDFDRDRENDRFDRYERDRIDFDRFGGNDWDRFGRDVRRNWWRDNDWNSAPFRYGWWNNYYGASWPVYSPWRFSRWQNRPYYWWSYTPATALTDWLVFGWNRPRYWAYGPGANIYDQDGYVYYDNRRTIAVNDYYQDIYNLAHSVPNISQEEAEKMDWKPLGVFALVRQNESQSQSQRVLQLAVNKDGVLTGTYYNRESNQAHPVSGMVDERTQRAAWAFADGEQKDVVFETAFYNLTRDNSTMMVHFGPQTGDTEVWHLVRLEQPENTGNTGSSVQRRPATSRTLP